MTPKRQAVETYVLKHLTAIDPSGYNADLYKEMFTAMDDAAFDKWMHSLKDKSNKLYIYTPNLKVMLNTGDLLAVAKSINLTLFERIKMWDNISKRYYTTPNKYLVLQLPVRRLKQYLMDKISVPENDRVTNPTTGQVVKPDKGSAISQTEAQTMDSKGLHRSISELLTVRGGNGTAYASFKSNLEETGQSTLTELDYSGGLRSAQVGKALLESMEIENNL